MPEAKRDFAKQLKELEAIAQWFSGEELDLDQALAKFERGMELATQLEKHLSVVKNKVEVIKKKFNQKPASKDVDMDEIVDPS